MFKNGYLPIFIFHLNNKDKIKGIINYLLIS